MDFWTWAMTGDNLMCLILVVAVVVVLVVAMITKTDI